MTYQGTKLYFVLKQWITVTCTISLVCHYWTKAFSWSFHISRYHGNWTQLVRHATDITSSASFKFHDLLSYIFNLVFEAQCCVSYKVCDFVLLSGLFAKIKVLKTWLILIKQTDFSFGGVRLWYLWFRDMQ